MNSERMSCVCLACKRTFREKDAARDSRGDRLCPTCGSPRIEPHPSRGQLLANFIIEYNRY